MQRLNPRSAAACSRTADALPEHEQVVTADHYAGWRSKCPRWDWPYGSSDFSDAIDRIVIYLVNEHRIVAMDRRLELQTWLQLVVFGYFELKALINSRMTDKQELICRRRIGQLGADLREEIVLLHGFDHHPDIQNLDEIVKRAQQGPRPLPDVWEIAPHGFDGPSTRASNASKDALHVLSQHICVFWTPVSWRRQVDGDLPFDFSVGSPAFRFARYVFGVVGEGTCTDRMIEKRLRAASVEIVASWGVWRDAASWTNGRSRFGYFPYPDDD